MSVTEARKALSRIVSSDDAAVLVGAHRRATALVLAGRAAERIMPYFEDEGFDLPSRLPELPRAGPPRGPLRTVERTAGRA